METHRVSRFWKNWWRKIREIISSHTSLVCTRARIYKVNFLPRVLIAGAYVIQKKLEEQFDFTSLPVTLDKSPAIEI